MFRIIGTLDLQFFSFKITMEGNIKKSMDHISISSIDI